MSATPEDHDNHDEKTAPPPLSEMQFDICDKALQLHGGAGYMNEYPIARFWRDARVSRIYSGTSEIMKEVIGRSLGLGGDK